MENLHGVKNAHKSQWCIAEVDLNFPLFCLDFPRQTYGNVLAYFSATNGNKLYSGN